VDAARGESPEALAEAVGPAELDVDLGGGSGAGHAEVSAGVAARLVTVGGAGGPRQLEVGGGELDLHADRRRAALPGARVDDDPVALAGRVVPQYARRVLIARDHEVHVTISVEVPLQHTAVHEQRPREGEGAPLLVGEARAVGDQE